MTTDTPLTRYSATNGALASGFVTAELHHLMGHDRINSSSLAISILTDRKISGAMVRPWGQKSMRSKLNSPAPAEGVSRQCRTGGKRKLNSSQFTDRRHG
ncbi:hypothetical protein D3227_33940 [Mesorhizobium waimense]|uniref:Uncharacterized protein n=1 Tax=Mesorhizobium waimense TaxID=1300307 RepID=A0A3A5K7W0_9HYPH|nr:hypothetical protein D3227_33940 [Mesorhizobium waimense]